MVSSLQAWQGWPAVRAGGADVAVASAMEAPSLQVQGDDGAWTRARHSACDLGIVHGIGLSLDSAVDHVFPDVCGVSTMDSKAKISTFGIFTTLILEVLSNSRDDWGLRHSGNIDADVMGRLDDVSSEGAHKAGIVGVDLGILGQEVGTDDVLMG